VGGAVDEVKLDGKIPVRWDSSQKEDPFSLFQLTADIEIKFQDDTVKQKMDGVIIATPSGSTGGNVTSTIL